MKNKLISALFIALASVVLTAQAQNTARPGFTPDATPPLAGEGAGDNAEDFADITLLPPLGYILTNESTPVGVNSWFQGNPGVFAAQAGADSAYIAANFNSTAGTGQICTYMILPDLGVLTDVTFWTRGPAGSIFPDRLRVLYSPTGGTTPGDCVGGDGDFTTELLSINDGLVVGGYPEAWTEFSVAPGGAGRVALVYDVPNGGPTGSNSNYIGIDTLSYVAVSDQARFLVTKDFDDDNTAEVEVTLSCNTGLPLQQTTTISEGDPVNFVIGDFAQGTLNCEVTEVVPDGYTGSYDDGDGVDNVNCSWADLSGAQYSCAISNTLDQVEVEVTKVWIDENPQFNGQNVAGANWSCTNVAFGDEDGTLDFFGNPGVDTFGVYPDWDLGTTCSITEVDLFESGVEVDDTECQGLVVWPGIGATCTIYNTRLYEGIPTLSQYGMAVLALMMLGVGLIGFRRFV